MDDHDFVPPHMLSISGGDWRSGLTSTGLRMMIGELDERLNTFLIDIEH